jgi:hypothetical protein
MPRKNTSKSRRSTSTRRRATRRRSSSGRPFGSHSTSMKISATTREERVAGLIEEIFYLFQEDIELSMPDLTKLRLEARKELLDLRSATTRSDGTENAAAEVMLATARNFCNESRQYLGTLTAAITRLEDSIRSANTARRKAA